MTIRVDTDPAAFVVVTVDCTRGSVDVVLVEVVIGVVEVVIGVEDVVIGVVEVVGNGVVDVVVSLDVVEVVGIETGVLLVDEVEIVEEDVSVSVDDGMADEGGDVLARDVGEVVVELELDSVGAWVVGAGGLGLVCSVLVVLVDMMSCL